jgi:hypothetical protein
MALPALRVVPVVLVACSSDCLAVLVLVYSDFDSPGWTSVTSYHCEGPSLIHPGCCSPGQGSPDSYLKKIFCKWERFHTCKMCTFHARVGIIRLAIGWEEPASGEQILQQQTIPPKAQIVDHFKQRDVNESLVYVYLTQYSSCARGRVHMDPKIFFLNTANREIFTFYFLWSSQLNSLRTDMVPSVIKGRTHEFAPKI